MTLVEFLDPIKTNKYQDRVLAVLYFCERYEQEPTLTADRIRQRLKGARSPNWSKINASDVLNKSGLYADHNSVAGKSRLWNLTESGRERIRTLLGLPASDPEIEHDIGALKAAIGKVKDIDVREYLEEAVKCLQVGALRPCVLSVWVAAARKIQHDMLANGTTAVTAAIQKHDSKAKIIKTADDFAYSKESAQLLAALDLGLFDKGQKDTLTDALNLRNKCGHPSKYRPGSKKVSAFVEDIVSVVFT